MRSQNRAALRQRAVAVAAFTTIAAATLPTVAAQAAETRFEAESMTRSSGAIHVEPAKAASAGKTLAMQTSPSSATKTVTTDDANLLSVRVRGTQCKGAPQLVVKVGSNQVMNVGVSQTRYVTKAAAVALKAGAHKITVAFPNNFRTSSCNRDLFVDQIKLAKATKAPVMGGVPNPAPSLKPAPAPAPAPVPAPAPGPVAAASSAGVLWGSNFEDGNLGIYKTVRTEGSGTRGSHVITTERARTGARSMKITLPASTSGGTIGRYQLVAGMPLGTNGQDRWYGYSLSLGNDWDLGQILDSRSYFLGGTGFRYTGTPANGPGSNLDATVVNGAAQWLTGTNLASTVGSDHVGEAVLGRVTVNQWSDFVFHMKWSTGSDGLREVWRDGVLVGRYSGPTLGLNSTFEHRIGLYQGTAVNQTRTMYVDNHRVGTSYAAVDPSR